MGYSFVVWKNIKRAPKYAKVAAVAKRTACKRCSGTSLTSFVIVNGKTIEKLKIKPTIIINANAVNKTIISLARNLIKKLQLAFLIGLVTDLLDYHTKYREKLNNYLILLNKLSKNSN